MNRNAFRDFFRRRRVARHIAAHGPAFIYHGLEVVVPASAGLAAMNALLRGKYESEEADLIARHLPAELPVIELGGSLGVVSRLIRSRLAPATRHLVVEANPDLIAACSRNALAGAAPDTTDVLNAALFHDGPEARFRIGEETHSNALDSGAGEGRVVSVPAVTLGDLHERIGSPSRFALVADIEGAEFALFENDAETLAKAALAIVELHPREYAKSGTSEAELIRLIEATGLKVAERRADVVLLKRQDQS